MDTREKDGKNDHIIGYFDAMKISWKKKKLEFGDYSFMIPQNEELSIPRDLYFDKEIIIERKASLDELASNLVADRARLKKELALAPPIKTIIIENNDYHDMVYGNYKSDYAAKSFYGSYHSFWHEFNTPIVFMPDNKLTGCFIVGYFKYYFRDMIK